VDEQEAVKWYKRGVTPGWLEMMLTAGYRFGAICEEFKNQTGIAASPKRLQQLAEYWGIE